MTGLDVVRFVSQWQRMPGGCVFWQGAYDKKGYGRFSFDGRDVPAHTFYLEWKLGRKLAPGMVAGHKSGCSRACVIHSEEITYSENLRRAWADGNRPGVVISPALWTSIKAELTAGARQCDLERKYNLKRAHITRRLFSERKQAQNANANAR